MVDGAIYQDEVEKLKIQGVPSVFADGNSSMCRKREFGELLNKLEAQYGIEENTLEVKEKVMMSSFRRRTGRSAAAIYSARKGLNVAVIAERIGDKSKKP